MAGSYLVVVIAGVVVDKLWLTPSSARLMLLRADCFLLPYALLTIQIYGANLTASVNAFRAVTVLVALCAILLPLPLSMFRLGLLLFLIMLVIWIDPKERADRFFSAVLSRFDWPPAARIVVAGCFLAILTKVLWSRKASSGFLTRFHCGVLRSHQRQRSVRATRLSYGARSNTPADARFLMPPDGCGFRVLSERSSWGEWWDGNAMIFTRPLRRRF